MSLTKRFLDRQGFKQPLRSVLDRAGDLLDRTVNYGTHVIPLIQSTRDENYSFPVAMLMRHALAMLDGWRDPDAKGERTMLLSPRFEV